MKRRILLFILTGALALGLTACDTREPEESSESVSSQSVSERSSEPESEPEPEPEESEPESEAEEESEPEPEESEPAPAAASQASQVEQQQAAVSFPEQSSALSLNPADITIYIQDQGVYTVNDMSAQADQEGFARTINNLRANPGATKDPEAFPDASFLIVRNDGERYIYNLYGTVLSVDGGDYAISEQSRQALLGYTNASVRGTYAQWLVFMSPDGIVSATANRSGQNGSVKLPSGGARFNALITALKQTGVTRGTGETYRPVLMPYPTREVKKPGSDYFQIKLLFENTLHYVITFDGTTLYVESEDLSFGCKYTLSGTASRDYIYKLFFSVVDEPQDIVDPQVNSEANPVTAKPVIYLYPEQTQDVQVQLDFKGTLGYTFPTYDSGWNVTAQPDGTLTNKTDGSTHYYLFWDGTPDRKQWDFSQGFIVEGVNVEAFFLEKLPLLGLTPREYNDFITYWAPEMSQNMYNLITFSTTEYEQTAPLTISPAPDTVLRVHMVYMPVYEQIEIEEQQLPQVPERNGFTVVEWGGTRAHKLQ